MNKSYCIALLCCASLSFFAQAQTSQVHIAGNDYPVTFTDTNLSAAVQQRMAADLTFVFTFASSFEELKGSEIETGVFRTRNTLPLFMGEDEHIFIIATNANPSVRIDKFLSDKYLTTFAWMDTNSNTVQKAMGFIAILNSPDLPSKPAQVLLNLNHVAPVSNMDENHPPSDAEYRTMITNHFFPFRYPGFSALHFYFRRVSGADIEIPLLFLVAVDKSDPSEMDALPIGFYKGKWGFGNFPNP